MSLSSSLLLAAACRLGDCAQVEPTPRTLERVEIQIAGDEARLLVRMTELACEDGRHGYRRIAELLRCEGWRVNASWIERLWR